MQIEALSKSGNESQKFVLLMQQQGVQQYSKFKKKLLIYIFKGRPAGL